MRKRAMKRKFFPLLLTLSMALSLPAGAFATTTAEGEGWRVDRSAYEDRFVAEYTAAHPGEYAAFDADAWFMARDGQWTTKEEYLAGTGLGEAAFRDILWRESLEPQTQAAYEAYIVQYYEVEFPGDIDAVGLPWAAMVFGSETREDGTVDEAFLLSRAAYYVATRQSAAYNHEESLRYRAQYPGSWEGYDPYAQFSPGWEHMIANTMHRYGLQTEEEFKEYWYVRYIPDTYLPGLERAAKQAEYLRRYPQAYAAFDPAAWFAGYYSFLSLTPEDYMAREGLDETGFKGEMFLEWADKAPTSFFNGLCVTVNGTPIQFQLYRGLDGEIAVPRAEHDRILIPLRAIAEALGLEVEWKPETHQATCAGAGTAVTFTLGSLEYSGGTLDAAPFAENGVTYLPLRALGEALGCQVTWNQDFATAALTTSN